MPTNALEVVGRPRLPTHPLLTIPLSLFALMLLLMPSLFYRQVSTFEMLLRSPNARPPCIGDNLESTEHMDALARTKVMTYNNVGVWHYFGLQYLVKRRQLKNH